MTVEDSYLAKYPFFEAAKTALGDVNMKEVINTDDAVLRRATERVVTGVNTGVVSSFKNNPGTYNEELEADITVEVKSYPVARLIVSLIGDYRIINRYARAEAETAHTRFEHEVKGAKSQNTISIGKTGKPHITFEEGLEEFDIHADCTELKDELHRTYIHDFFTTASNDDIRSFVSDVFKLDNVQTLCSDDRLSQMNASKLYEFLHSQNGTKFRTDWYRLPIVSYLKTSVGMNESRWRLTNRGLNDGNLIITKKDLYDLFEEAVHQRVEDKLPYEVPEEITTSLRNAEPFKNCDDVPSFWEGFPSSRGDVTELDSDKDGVKDNEYDFIELVRAAIDDDHFSYEIDRVEPGLFPPVIERLLEGVRNGENLQHEARFTLVAFLINIGMTENEIVEMLEVGGSFGEEATRYQVGHIMQGGDGGDAYTPANYVTMESWGLEWQKDALEAQVTNPLTYYKIKLKEQEEQEEEDEEETTETEDDDSFEPTEVSPKTEIEGGPTSAEIQEFADETE